MQKPFSFLQKMSQENHLSIKQTLYHFLDQHKLYTVFPKNREDRSQTVIVVDCQNKATTIRAKAKEQKIIIGSGYGKYKETHLRIANFPALTITDMKKLIKTLYQVS